MSQLPNTATIKDIIAALQTMECLNQKADLASAVGSPAVSTDDVATIVSKLQNAKNTLAANLTAKGSASTSAEALQALADKVGSMVVKRYATGTSTSDASKRITVTGLSFKPTFIIIIAFDGTTTFSTTQYIEKSYFGTATDYKAWIYQSGAPDLSYPLYVSVAQGTFAMETVLANKAYKWFAFE